MMTFVKAITSAMLVILGICLAGLAGALVGAPEIYFTVLATIAISLAGAVFISMLILIWRME
jgi:hypothetical protein